ncbi:hypothetical protein BT96DRAFT_999139 [Gymnopus androsaceus JB14]|uniref:Uncharacterized protein n=1 Tax=Gymnopus androsaceus JB14 TaxID=1447944 RepID=A0A6A4H9C5_9AGAR|nr:hypothetical protein BT96DRAFT_999139 [Gymnopus androsaceus JB14]
MVFIAALKDVAFFIVNRDRKLFRDSALEVAIMALSFSVDLMNVVGFIAFMNIDKGVFSYNNSSPSCLLSSPHAVAKTLRKARELAGI